MSARRRTSNSVNKQLQPSWIGGVALSLNILFWGAAGSIVKWGLAEIPPQIFLYYRFVLVLAITAPIVWLLRHRFTSIRSPQTLIQICGIGLLTNPICLGLLFWGTSLTTAISASILSSLTPIYILVLAHFFLKERITKAEVLGTGVALLGTMLFIVGTPTQSDAPYPLAGNLLILCSNISWTAGVLLMKKHATAHHPFVFSFAGWTTGMLVCGILTWLTDPRFFFRPLLLTQLPQASWSVVYMALFGSLVGFTAYQIAQRSFSASRVSFSAYLLPLIGVPLGALWLKEEVGTFFIPATVLLILGVFIAQYRGKDRLTRAK